MVTKQNKQHKTHTRSQTTSVKKKINKSCRTSAGSCDCADKTQCVKKGTSYTFDIVETEESYKEAIFMDVAAEENGCQCKCGSTCSFVNCTCN